jgi:signal transduction histidine kinase
VNNADQFLFRGHPIKTKEVIVADGDQVRPEHGQRGVDIDRSAAFCAVLLAMAGHDLRQPLQVIMNNHTRLVNRLNSGPDLECLRRDELAITQLITQLDRLVEASRIHTRAGYIKPAATRLQPLLGELCRDNTELARKKDVELRVCPTSAVVMSDAVLLDGIMRNLVRNAVKFTPPGGRILVGCRRSRSHIRIEVHDTGVGIAPEHLSTIFEAFRRVDSVVADGLGLGLFIVRRAGELLGHRLSVRSEVGRGSCFSILAAPADEVDYGSCGESIPGAGLSF